MNLATLMLIPALFGLLSACSTNCESQCEDRKQCTAATVDEKSRDCEQYCSDEEDFAKAKGCESEHEALTDCLDDQGDVCSSAAYDACQGQVTALSSCELP